MALIIILCCLPVIIELGIDYYLIKIRKRSDKPVSTIARGLMMIVIALGVHHSSQYNWWSVLALEIGIFVLIFDYLVHTIVLGKGPFYVPENPKGWDKFLAWLPTWYVNVFFRLWAFIVGLLTFIYY